MSAWPPRASGHGACLDLATSCAADPQLEPPGVLVGDRLGPHRAERAAQPGGELLAALGDHGRGHPVGQVDLGPPAGAVLAHRGREHQLRGRRGATGRSRRYPATPSARVMTSWSGRLHRRRERGGGDDRLVRGRPVRASSGSATAAEQDPRPRRGAGPG